MSTITENEVYLYETARMTEEEQEQVCGMLAENCRLEIEVGSSKNPNDKKTYIISDIPLEPNEVSALDFRILDFLSLVVRR